jgi:hypothetical protein
MLAQPVQLEKRMALGMMTHLEATLNATQSSAPSTNEW